jgi:AcrR family transcriptional regulator
MKRRAELEEETRRRIAESTVQLHETVGPARTSISAVAELAGVRRSTVYRHFPDEAALFAACRAHWYAANPRPDTERWRAVDDPGERLRTALEEMYAYYRRTQDMWTSLLRDESLVPTLADQLAGYHAFQASIADLLMKGRPRRKRVRAAIGHALAFQTWRSLAVDQGLSDDDAAALMRALVDAAGGGQRSQRTAV